MFDNTEFSISAYYQYLYILLKMNVNSKLTIQLYNKGDDFNVKIPYSYNKYFIITCMWYLCFSTDLIRKRMF